MCNHSQVAWVLRNDHFWSALSDLSCGGCKHGSHQKALCSTKSWFSEHVVTTLSSFVRKHSLLNPVIFQVAATLSWFCSLSSFCFNFSLLKTTSSALYMCARGDSVPLDFERRHSCLIKPARLQSEASALHVALPACSSAACSCCSAWKLKC